MALRWTMSALLGSLFVAVAASGCAGKTTARIPSPAEQRDLAGRFAAALLRGDAVGARALLAPGDDGALTYLVQQATAPPKAQRTSLRLHGRHAKDHWTFGYVRRRTYPDLRFETESGDLLVFIAQSREGAGVGFFAFTNVRTHFSTHHDSRLLPSNR
jgi:hypothetical protein